MSDDQLNFLAFICISAYLTLLAFERELRSFIGDTLSFLPNGQSYQLAHFLINENAFIIYAALSPFLLIILLAKFSK